MDRRDFIKVSGAVAAGMALTGCGPRPEKTAVPVLPPTEPFGVLHVSDTHIVRADELSFTNGNCGYLTGVPEEFTSKYDPGVTYPAGQEWRYRKVQQHSDEPTMEGFRLSILSKRV